MCRSVGRGYLCGEKKLIVQRSTKQRCCRPLRLLQHYLEQGSRPVPFLTLEMLLRRLSGRPRIAIGAVYGAPVLNLYMVCVNDVAHLSFAFGMMQESDREVYLYIALHHHGCAVFREPQRWESSQLGSMDCRMKSMQTARSSWGWQSLS